MKMCSKDLAFPIISWFPKLPRMKKCTKDFGISGKTQISFLRLDVPSQHREYMRAEAVLNSYMGIQEGNPS